MDVLHCHKLMLKGAEEFGIQFKAIKCCFFATELDVLGHHVTQERWFLTEKGVDAVQSFPRPQNATAVKKVFRNVLFLLCLHSKFVQLVTTLTQSIAK